ncbi:MAG: lipoprotein bor [SAR324 cluster bacterium]|nr:lipoprotein bor [SAR324 cluster bacterium]
MKHLFVGACVIGLLGLGGCAKQVFLLGEINENQPELEERHDFFVSGLSQTKTINSIRGCEHAENVAQLEVERPTFDNFLGFFNTSICAPATACIYCNAK